MGQDSLRHVGQGRHLTHARACVTACVMRPRPRGRWERERPAATRKLPERPSARMLSAPSAVGTVDAAV